MLAKKRGIFLEITSRLGHAATNTYVVKQARKFGAKLILNNDSHSPDDIITPEELTNIGIQAGLTKEELEKIYAEVAGFLKLKEAR